MATTKIDAGVILSRLKNAVNDFDDNSVKELELLQHFLQLKNRHLARQKQILVARQDEEAIQAIDEQTLATTASVKALDREIGFSKIVVPSFDNNNWRVHGQVIGDPGKVVSGATVMLLNAEKKSAIKDIQPATTDAQGYFSITLNPEQIKNLKDAKVLLSVSMKRKKLIIPDEEPILVTPGKMESRNLFIVPES